MKRQTILLGILAVGAIGLVVWLSLKWSARLALHGTTQSAAIPHSPLRVAAGPDIQNPTNSAEGAFPSLAARRKMPDAERLRWLEQYGRVPDDADWKDVDLAGRTTWWGRPLDPETFWKGRVVWYDESAKREAAVHGRAWPPIPYDDATLARLFPSLVKAYPTEGRTTWSQPGLDSPPVTRGSAMTDRERAFWTEFIRTRPHPPEDIEGTQLRVAEQILKLQKRIGAGPLPLTVTDAERRAKTAKQAQLDWGYPPEALADEALLWAYIVNRRQEYERLRDAGSQDNSIAIKHLFDSLLVDSNYITEPLTAEQLKAANAWKIAYLQRLRREQVDESYINAYLKAWNLSAAEVFGSTNQP